MAVFSNPFKFQNVGNAYNSDPKTSMFKSDAYYDKSVGYWRDTTTGKHRGDLDPNGSSGGGSLGTFASFTGVGALTLAAAELVTPLLKKMYEPYLPPDKKTPTPSTIPEPEKITPAGFHYDSNNTPFLGVGMMNSAEIVAQKIDTQTKQFNDNFQEKMTFDYSMAQLQVEQSEALNKTIGSVAVAITALVNTLAKLPTDNLLPAVGAVASAVSNIPQTTLTTENTQPAQVDLSDLNLWAKQALNRENFLQTKNTFHLSDGEEIAHASPLEIEAQKNAHALHKLNDENTYTVDDDEINPSLFSSLELLKFKGRNDIFNPEFSEPSVNPFK